MRSVGIVAGAFVVSFAGISLAAGKDAPETAARDAGADGACLTLEPAIAERFRLAQSEPSKASAPESAPKVQRPMTDAELRLLIAALSAADRGVDDGEKLAAADMRSQLPIDRLAVLVLDVSTILAQTHLQETLVELRGLPDIDKGIVAWGENVLAKLGNCVRARYENHGGQAVYDRTVRAVLNQRELLERLIAGNAVGRRPPRPVETK